MGCGMSIENASKDSKKTPTVTEDPTLLPVQKKSVPTQDGLDVNAQVPQRSSSNSNKPYTLQVFDKAPPKYEPSSSTLPLGFDNFPTGVIVILNLLKAAAKLIYWGHKGAWAALNERHGQIWLDSAYALRPITHMAILLYAAVRLLVGSALGSNMIFYFTTFPNLEIEQLSALKLNPNPNPNPSAAHPTNVILPPRDFQHLPPSQPAHQMNGSSQSFGIHATAYHGHSYSPGQVKREGHSPSSPRRQTSMGNAPVPPQSPPPHNGLYLQSELGDHGQPNFRPQWSAPAPPANDGQVPLLSQRYPAPYQGNHDLYQPPGMQRHLQSPLPCQPCQISTVTPNGHPAHGIGPQSSVSPSPPQHPLHMDGRRQQSQASLPPPLPNHGQEPPPSSLPQQPSQSPPTKKAPSFGNPPGPPVSPQNMPTPMPHNPSQPQTHNHTHIQSPYKQSPTHNKYPTPFQGNQEYSPYGSASSRPRHRVAQRYDSQLTSSGS
ncbi:uncharacterized protein PpBr36_11274 [Pyricularia pennisetigena]|uniref:uncharacterized protein n=1 Tax=Pyricularia pennisetigena TaxID=1578925 RepID=UPI0011523D4A|nr:uncharacterized protein PpBr36_11274 [Pyricularia pennisetigena]TLS20450.1 hypothetical protein PpBr36_11274 [Pyricularia pennisetigena]